MGETWKTNKKEVRKALRDGGWVLALGKEIDSKVAGEGLAAVALSVVAENPEPFRLWLTQLIEDSIREIGESVRREFTAEAINVAIGFARRVIESLMDDGKITEGESDTLELNRVDFKAGVAKYVGANYWWNPAAKVEDLEDFFGGITGQKNIGGWEQIGPDLPSWQPYIAMRIVLGRPPAPLPTDPRPRLVEVQRLPGFAELPDRIIVTSPDGPVQRPPQIHPELSDELADQFLSEFPPYLFSQSYSRRLEPAELSLLGPEELFRARNEIFARRGLIFSTERGRRLAERLGESYKGSTTDARAVGESLNPIELHNVNLIREFEKRFER